MEEYIVRRKVGNPVLTPVLEEPNSSFTSTISDLNAQTSLRKSAKFSTNTETQSENLPKVERIEKPENTNSNQKVNQNQNSILSNLLLFLLFLCSMALLFNQIKLFESADRKIEIISRDTNSIKENIIELNDSLKQLKQEINSPK